MANVVIPNFITNGTDMFNVVWKLSRAMKKAGWVYKSSSNTTTKDTSGIATNDLWGGNADPNLDSYPNFNAAANTVSVGSQTLPLATFNATNPIAAGFPSSGTFQVLSATGIQTITYTGTTTTSFTGCTGGTGLVSTSTPITVGTTTSWWNAQGPSTLKIPITSAQISGSLGNFIRGENITQATTGAQGELLGYLFDGYAFGNVGAGYLVVAPRVDGSGGDPHGWDHTNTITGNISGASVTPSAAIVEFVREVVFWKANNLTQGTIFHQCINNTLENSSRFSVITSNATVDFAPGGGTGSNAFPTPGSFVVQGTGGVNLPSNWFQAGTPQPYGFGRALFIATPAGYATNSSADGSFTVAVGTPGIHSGSFVGFMFMRVDSQEDGDVDPYVWFAPSNKLAPGNTGASGPSRTSDTSVYTNANWGNNDYWYTSGYGNGGPTVGLTSNNNAFKFWRRRGWNDTADAFSGGVMTGISFPATGIVFSQNNWDREKVANAYVDTNVMEDVWCVSYQTFQKTRKGVCRWLKTVNMGSACAMYKNKSWIQLGNPGCNNGTTTPNWSWVVGPWDGVTTQVQA